jgi:hypothetical protein
MIDGLTIEDTAWLSEFFSSPNELTWASIQEDLAPPEILEHIRPWLQALADPDSKLPIILPFVKAGEVERWYATTRSSEGGHELGAELRGWLGPTYLSFFELVTRDPLNASVAALKRRPNGLVWQFTVSNIAAKQAVLKRLNEYAGLLRRRPPLEHSPVRPVGAIRGDFERALLVKDASAAESFIAELKATGRLNEENLRFLEVRFSAGLGHWPQIARNHWLIQTISDLALPPRILSDVIEALYRTYIEPVEATGVVADTLAAFDCHVAQRYPRLLASRKGIRTSRVVKAFLLFEQLQPRPSNEIIAELTSLLQDCDRALVLADPSQVEPNQTMDPETEADEAFDDLQYDRAFAFYTALPLSKKTLGRLLNCARFIDTDDIRARLFSIVENANPKLIESLPLTMRERFTALNALEPEPVQEADANYAQNSAPVGKRTSRSPGGWMEWAEQLLQAQDLVGAEHALQIAVTNWSTSEFESNSVRSRQFADMIGNLNADAAVIVRRAVPQIFESFFPADAPPSEGSKPVAEVLFALVAMDDGLSTSDLDILAQLLSILLILGLSSDEYVSIVSDLEDVQERVRSYANLPWCLDVCETLAISPAQSENSRGARLEFFLRILGHAQAFAHRLGPQDFLPIQILCQDFKVDPELLDALKRVSLSSNDVPKNADMTGKVLGIYTLAQAAGARAKTALEQIFPGSRVEVNSDTVATEKLKNLARVADIFIFVWKSSSHAAFYCIKDALGNTDPIWASGKGSASIIRAVLEHVEQK